jgi:hypothetical protein
VSLAFGALGLAGAAAHRRVDRRSWRALLTLFACASAGLVIYMNFKAGASFAWTVVSDDTKHEVRERDYFFLLAFMAWGAWAAIGGAALAARASRARRASAVAALAVAALPVALNWRAVTRRAEPEARLPRLVGEALLWSVPPRAVLVTGGDDDSFPSWYLQVLEGMRRDVSVVVAPLLGANWYRAELERRGVLRNRDVVSRWRGEAATLAAVADAAKSAGRPLAVAITARERYRLIPRSRRVLRGLAYVESGDGGFWSDRVDAYVDTAARADYDRRFGAVVRAARARESTDPLAGQLLEMLQCPASATVPAESAARADSVAAARRGAAGAPDRGTPSLASSCGPR